MDTNEEERAKGKTVEVGRAHFTTATKRYTLLDAPGMLPVHTRLHALGIGESDLSLTLSAPHLFPASVQATRITCRT
jgi:translation elongation factor EF-1alpha